MAERGFNGVSLRDIAAECGLHFSLITHYFGTKHSLLESIFARRTSRLNDARKILLDQYTNTVLTEGPSLHALVIAFCKPLFTLAREPQGFWFLRLQNLVFVEDGPVARQIKAQFYDPTSRRMVRLIGQALPDWSKAHIFLVFNYLIGATFGMIRDQTHAGVLSDGKVDADHRLDEEMILNLLLNGLQTQRARGK